MNVDEQLITTIACLRTPTSDMTSTMKSTIVKTAGVEALATEVFGLGLWDARKEEALEEAAQDLQSWKRAGYDVIPVYDKQYPKNLRKIRESPGLLFSQGIPVAQDRSVNIVGSRKATAEDLDMTQEVCHKLASYDITVASGLARGIDTMAHTATLASKGRTVAIMGTGLDQTYPAENENLRQRIENAGQVISQFYPGAPIARHHFPTRNITLSGYSATTIVMAAGEQSGTRHMVQTVVQQGRTLILSSKVAATTTWGKKYATQYCKAYVVESARDIVDCVLRATENGL